MRQVGTDPIARCGYCGADNVVTPDDMARAHHRRVTSLGEYEAHLRELSATAERGARRLIWSIFGYAVLAPFLGIIGGCCCTFSVLQLDTPADLTREYTFIDGPEAGSRCLAEVRSRRDGEVWLKTPDYEHPGGHGSTRVPEAGLERFPIDHLIGTYLARRDRGGRYRVGRVVGVHAELSGDNYVVVEHHDTWGDSENQYMATTPLCIPPPGAAIEGLLPHGYTPPGAASP